MRIGELAVQSGVTTKALRFYEQSGVLPEPDRTSNGYRDYGPEFLERLHFTRCAQSVGLTLREVRDILAIHDRGMAPCDQVVEVLTQHLVQVRAHLRELAALETNLVSLLERAREGAPHIADDVGVCWILESDPAPVGTPSEQHGVTTDRAWT